MIKYSSQRINRLAEFQFVKESKDSFFMHSHGQQCEPCERYSQALDIWRIRNTMVPVPFCLRNQKGNALYMVTNPNSNNEDLTVGSTDSKGQLRRC